MDSSSIGYEFLADHIAFNRMVVRYKPVDEAIATIRSTEGYIPVAIDPLDGGRIYWANLGDRPLREWQFLYSVNRAVNEGGVDAFFTDIQILSFDDVLTDCAPVRGLIFHISRCGSTLLGKCLAACPNYLVVNQGGPLQRGFWAWATNDFKDSLPTGKPYRDMFRRLVAAMARRRGQNYEASFVKFISWNTLYLDFIRATFPETPALFMYRDPVEVIAAVQAETTAALLAKGTEQARFLTGLEPSKTTALSDVQYLIRCYQAYFRTALGAKDLPLLNYRELKRGHLGEILRLGLDLKPDHGRLLGMAKPFDTHSKDDTGKSAFKDDRAKKQAALANMDRRLIREGLGKDYQKLEQSPTNLRRMIENGVLS